MFGPKGSTLYAVVMFATIFSRISPFVANFDKKKRATNQTTDLHNPDVIHVSGLIRNIKKNNKKKLSYSENSNLFECCKKKNRHKINDIFVYHIFPMHLTCDQSCGLVVTSVHTGDKSVVPRRILIDFSPHRR